MLGVSFAALGFVLLSANFSIAIYFPLVLVIMITYEWSQIVPAPGMIPCGTIAATRDKAILNIVTRGVEYHQ